MDEVEETKLLYNQYAQEYEEKTKDYVEKHIPKDFDLFLRNLKGKRILDVGSDPGRDSIRFKQNGFHPICIDISSAMVKLCKNKGLEAYEMDMENLDFEDASFDGVWAYASLLHLPKSRIKKVIAKIGNILKAKGVFYLGMKAGNSEGYEENKLYPNCRRYLSLYAKEELEELLTDFHILHFSKVKIGSEHIYLNFLCQKKS